MKRWKKKLTGLMLIVVLTLTATACGNTDNKNNASENPANKTDDATKKEKITFVLDWSPNTNHTGLYVAQEKGYFEEAGLEVSIVQPPEGGAEALVASGKAEFGVSFQDSLAPALIGENALPITSVATIIQHNTSGIISRKGEGMDSPKGLENKKYATWDMEVEKAMMKNVVEKAGGDFSKVELIPSTVSDEVSALQSKQVDAIWIFYAWAGIATEVKGLQTDYFNFKDINPVFDYYTPVIVAGTDFLEKKPETAKAFLKALKKGYEDAIANPEEAANILLKEVPELDKEIVLKSQKWLANQYKAEVSQWGYIDPARWNGFYNWLNDNGLVTESIPENTGFTNEYLPE